MKGNLICVEHRLGSRAGVLDGRQGRIQRSFDEPYTGYGNDKRQKANNCRRQRTGRRTLLGSQVLLCIGTRCCRLHMLGDAIEHGLGLTSGAGALRRSPRTFLIGAWNVLAALGLASLEVTHAPRQSHRQK